MVYLIFSSAGKKLKKNALNVDLIEIKQPASFF